VTDGRTDGIAMAYTRYSIYAVALKKTKDEWSHNNDKQEPNNINHITPVISMNKSNNSPKFLVATSTDSNRSSLLKLNPL